MKFILLTTIINNSMAQIAPTVYNSTYIPIIINMIKNITDNNKFDIKTRYDLICSIMKIYDEIDTNTEDDNIKEMIVDLNHIKESIEIDKIYDYEFKMNSIEAVWMYSNWK